MRNGAPSGARSRRGVEAAPAATVVLLRDGEHGLEVLLGKRSSKLKFHGGAWVFPGGRIDPDDYGDDPDDLDAAARRAAAREAKEEAGVDVDPDALVHFSNWTTPDDLPEAVRDVVLRRPGRGRDRRSRTAPRPTRSSGSDRTRRSPRTRPPRSSSRRRSTCRCSTCATYGTVAEAMAGIAAATPVDYLPRFHFVEGGGAVCIYSEDVAYDDITQFDAEGTRHRLYLDDAGWNYLRD